MPKGMFKSRTMRRVFRRTPGGKTVLAHELRKPAKVRCSRCDAVLPGVPQLRVPQLRTIAKSSKRPERPFGGVLCSRCSRLEQKKRARLL